ncbi:MAG: hypothetical protein KF901_04455 [Myxococcales bacterium]|nr:hypothetical protein [Myxococcales bacterium]
MYRSSVATIDDLEPHEQLAFGGLIRVLIRLDGHFSELEEEHLERVAEEIGGREALWALISRSAQEHRNDDAIRDAARGVVRSDARVLIRDALESIARAETIVPAEQRLLDWLDETWSA